MGSFDYLNAAPRKRGIRLALSLHWSRKFLPGDAASIRRGRRGLADAVRELNGWSGRSPSTPSSSCPSSTGAPGQLLQKEFASMLLAHRNPYTGKTYGEDAQVLYGAGERKLA